MELVLQPHQVQRSLLQVVHIISVHTMVLAGVIKVLLLL